MLPNSFPGEPVQIYLGRSPGPTVWPRYPVWFSPPPQGLLRDEKYQGHLIIHPVALIRPGICYIQTHLPSPPPPSAQALMGWGNPREQQAAPQGQAGTAQMSPGPTSRLGRGRWARGHQCCVRHSEAVSRVRLARCGGSRHVKLGDTRL